MPPNSHNIEHQIYTMCMIQRNNEILLIKRPSHRGFPGYIAPGGKVDFPEYRSSRYKSKRRNWITCFQFNF